MQKEFNLYLNLFYTNLLLLLKLFRNDFDLFYTSNINSKTTKTKKMQNKSYTNRIFCAESMRRSSVKIPWSFYNAN